MPFFNYTALKSGRDLISGRIEANSLKDARESLRKLNLVPTKIEQQGETAKEKKANEQKKEKKVKLRGLKMRDKIDFTNTLHVLSKTGISIIEALLFIEVNSNSKNVQMLAAELRKQVLGGANLSDAISKYPHIFDDMFSGLVRAGEESGELDTTLARVAELLDKQDKLRSKVMSIMAYPVFVMILAMLVTTVMLVFVFPAFKDMYDNMNKELPWITQTLMDIGIFLKTNWFMIPIILGAVVGSVYTLFSWPTSRKVIDKISLKLPVIKKFVELTALSNFISVLKVAFDAGVPIVDSLLLANLTVRNYVIKESLRECATKIQHGQSLSAALKSTGVIPGILMCMISTGEQSGQLGDMLLQAGTYIDTQLDRVVELLSKLMEPLMLIIIGGIVLVLALALYLPLFQSYSNIV